MAAPQGVYPGYGPAGNAATLVQKIELRLACKNLPNKDVGSKSDPCAVVYFKVGEKFKEVISLMLEILKNMSMCDQKQVTLNSIYICEINKSRVAELYVPGTQVVYRIYLYLY